MFAKSLLNRMAMFDVYKKVPKDISYATYSGAISTFFYIVSLAAIILILLLVLSEIKIYNSIET